MLHRTVQAQNLKCQLEPFAKMMKSTDGNVDVLCFDSNWTQCKQIRFQRATCIADIDEFSSAGRGSHILKTNKKYLQTMDTFTSYRYVTYLQKTEVELLLVDTAHDAHTLAGQHAHVCLILSIHARLPLHQLHPGASKLMDSELQAQCPPVWQNAH